MNRSDFIKSLGLGMGGIILPTTSYFTTQLVKIYDNYVRGIQFYDFKKIAELLKQGDEIVLKRDSENIHDAFATEIRFKEYKLGYIAAYENIVLANMLNQNISLIGKISKIDLNSYDNKVAIEIYAELVIPSEKLITMMSSENRSDDAIDLYRNNY
ncbi:HIRAN domain-containing protein [Kaistella sp.]|uniref:HIRAN domain-containing protein n=1 Tax=Kaistella sp. TaxID=2782235 RepID=UPI003C42E593